MSTILYWVPGLTTSFRVMESGFTVLGLLVLIGEGISFITLAMEKVPLLC